MRRRPRTQEHREHLGARWSRAVRAAAVVAVVGGVLGLAPGGPSVPVASASTATDGVRTLTLSESQGLEPGGHALTVTGSGYDVTKGVYVALCVMPPPGTQPGPCGGGADREGTAGASAWISSDPPPYAVGLTQPYGPGGTFRATISVAAQVAPGVDCRSVPCAVVTRADHLRSADRSQDVLVPVTFATPLPATPGTPPVPGPVGPAAPIPLPTAPPATTTTAPAPITTTTTTVDADGRAVGDGTRRLGVDRAHGLSPDGDRITVSGTGFDAARGVYVSLCGPPPTPGERPVPCATGEGRSAWISSSPPDYGIDLARPYDEGGSFEVALDVAPTIDADTDCRVVPCVLVVRNDDTAPDDRSQDLVLPVAFDGEPGDPDEDGGPEPAPAAPGPSEAAAPVDDASAGGGSAPPVAVVALVAAVVLGVAGTALVLRRRAGGPA